MDWDLAAIIQATGVVIAIMSVVIASVITTRNRTVNKLKDDRIDLLEGMNQTLEQRNAILKEENEIHRIENARLKGAIDTLQSDLIAGFLQAVQTALVDAIHTVANTPERRAK